MERVRLIEHLLDHYVARDKFRFIAAHHLQQRGMTSSTSFLQDGEVSERAIHTNRESLKKVKHETLDHLHDLLHKELVLDQDEHLHTDEDIFRFIIEEEEDAVA